MHMRSNEDARRLLRMMPERYTWNACRLTRNLMLEGRSVPMQQALERLAIWHMKGEKEWRTGYETLSGLQISLARRTDPPVGFKDAKDFLKMIKNDSWNTEDEEPVLKVDIVAQIEPPGPNPGWTLNHAKLSIESPPLSVVTRVTRGDAVLTDLIQGPYLDGFSIHSAWWKGGQWKDGKEISFNPPGEMNTHLEIMLEGANDYQPIEIKLS